MYSPVVGYQILLDWKLHLSKSTGVWKDVTVWSILTQYWERGVYVCGDGQIKIALLQQIEQGCDEVCISFKDVLKFVLTACLRSLLLLVTKVRHCTLRQRSFQFVLGFACVQVREEDAIQCILHLLGLALI